MNLNKDDYDKLFPKLAKSIKEAVAMPTVESHMKAMTTPPPISLAAMNKLFDEIFGTTKPQRTVEVTHFKSKERVVHVDFNESTLVDVENALRNINYLRTHDTLSVEVLKEPRLVVIRRDCKVCEPSYDDVLPIQFSDDMTSISGSLKFDVTDMKNVVLVEYYDDDMYEVA
jgi:hypothetical protein